MRVRDFLWCRCAVNGTLPGWYGHSRVVATIARINATAMRVPRWFGHLRVVDLVVDLHLWEKSGILRAEDVFFPKFRERIVQALREDVLSRNGKAMRGE